MHFEAICRRRGRESVQLGTWSIIRCAFLLCLEVLIGTGAEDACTTHGCITIARRIALNMNPSVDVCHNIYNFACGSFNLMAGKRDVTSTDHWLAWDIHDEIKKMMEAKGKVDEPRPFKLLKKLYKTCMDPRNYGDQAKADLKSFLKKRGGWPVVEGRAWIDKDFTWRQKIRKFQHDEGGLGDFTEVRIDKNPKQKGSRMISLRSVVSTAPTTAETAAFNHTDVQKWYKFIVELAVELGANRAYALTELKESVLFDLQRKKIHLTNKEKEKSKSPNMMTIRELKRKYPSVPWVENIKSILNAPKVEIRDDEVINVPVPEYFVRVEALMAKTPTKIQANSIIARIAARNAEYSSERVRRVKNDYLTAQAESPHYPQKQTACMKDVVGGLWPVFNSMVIRKYLSVPAAHNVSEIVKAMKEHYIKKIDWLTPYYAAHEDPQTVKEMRMVTDAVSDVLYPPDDAALETFYANLTFDDESYFKNIERLAEFDARKEYTQLRKPAEFDDLTQYFETTSMNPASLGSQDFIAIPRNIIQILYANDHQPQSLGYATIGINIARDIISGSYIGTSKDICSCNECIIEKWDNFTLDKKKLQINGTRTLIQNKIEIASLRVAYDAYIAWLTSEDETTNLPGFEQYTPEQMFWIAAASNICTKHSEKTFKKLMTTGPIIPQKYQVNILFSNMPEFAKDFGCASWSQMKSKTSCDIW